MLDTTFSTYQRSRGVARVGLGVGGQIETLYQAGSAKAMIPRTHGPAPEVVFLNTSGGLTGGDTLDFALTIAPGASALAATQTAERAYASPGGAPARVRVDLSVGEGATLFWLPQETILFNRSSLARQTHVHLAEGARFLGIETIVLGRAHMGEQVDEIAFQDARRVYDAIGIPLHAEQIELDGQTLGKQDEPAVLAGASVVASVTYVAPDAEDKLNAVRQRLDNASANIAASAWDGRLVIRALGDDAWNVRAALLPALRYLTDGALPRVWQF